MFSTFCPKINFSTPNVTWDILYIENLLGHPSSLHFQLYKKYMVYRKLTKMLWITFIWLWNGANLSIYKHVTHFVPNIRRKAQFISTPPVIYAHHQGHSTFFVGRDVRGSPKWPGALVFRGRYHPHKTSCKSTVGANRLAGPIIS